MKVYEAVADAIVAEDCGAMFGLMGDGNMLVWGALGKRGFPIYSARHEASAVGMADGYSRTTGKVGVASITWGPGLTQAATPLVVAARNRSSLVLVVGVQAKDSRDPHQTLDHRKFAELCGLAFHEVNSADAAAQQIAEAFYTARVHRRPVLLNIAMDVQMEALEWDWDYRPSSEFHVAPSPMEPDPLALRRVYEALAHAERPVLVAGRGAQLAGARDELIRLGELSGALLATSLPAKGMFSDQPFDIGVSGSFCGAAAEGLFAEADFVLGFGAELGHFSTEGGLLYPSAEIARVDVREAPDQIGPVPGLYVRGDAALAARHLAEMFEREGPRRTGFRTQGVAARITAPSAELDVPNDGLDPRRILFHLSQALPRNTRVVSGVGHYWGFVAQHLAIPPEAELQIAYQFGSIAQALSQSIGMAASGDGRPTLLIEGDGSLLCHVQEIAVAVRHKLPLVMLILNDSGFGAEVHKLKAKGFDPGLARWDDTDLVRIAQAFGAEAVGLEREDAIGDLVLGGMEDGKVLLIDARISPSTVSDTYRKLHLGEENRAPVLRVPALEDER